MWSSSAIVQLGRVTNLQWKTLGFVFGVVRSLFTAFMDDEEYQGNWRARPAAVLIRLYCRLDHSWMTFFRLFSRWELIPEREIELASSEYEPNALTSGLRPNGSPAIDHTSDYISLACLLRRFSLWRLRMRDHKWPGWADDTWGSVTKKRPFLRTWSWHE